MTSGPLAQQPDQPIVAPRSRTARVAAQLSAVVSLRVGKRFAYAAGAGRWPESASKPLAIFWRGCDLRQPPYARLMRKRAANPLNRSVAHAVLLGNDAWQTASRWREDSLRAFTLCPPGEDPAGFDWTIYRKAPPPVSLIRCGRVDGDQLHRLVRAMLAAGSPRIFDLLADAVYQPKAAA